MSAIDRDLVTHLRDRLVSERRLGAGEIRPDTLRRAVEELLEEERRLLPPVQRERLLEAVADEALGLGPVARLLRDPTVTEVMVNGPDRVFVERAGRIEPAGARFDDDAHVLNVADRMLAAVGRRVDETSPMADARLADGSRVNVVIPPVAVDGPVVTIRRFAREPLDLDALIALGTLDRTVAEVLETAVRARRNVVITGGTGSGKTTTLAAVAGLVPPGERVVTIEDAAELRLRLPHVVRLEARPASIEGRGAVPIRALVRNALRMRPDRIIVGEVRGGECLDMLQAMSTGHDGSLSTLHASSAGDALRRLVLLALMGGVELPHRAVAEQVAAALDLVCHQERGPDGRRRVVEIAAVDPGPDGPRTTTLVRRAGDGEQDVWAIQPALASWRASLPGAAAEGTG